MIFVHKIVWHPRLGEKGLNCPGLGGGSGKQDLVVGDMD